MKSIPFILLSAFLASTSAAQAQAPVITRIGLSNQVPRMTIESPTGVTNQIQYSTNLSQTQWSVLTNLLVGGSPYQIVDAGAVSARQRFYRVAATTPLYTVTLLQLWGSSTRTNRTTTLIQKTSVATPVNTSSVSFDAAHTTVWIPVSYVPDWPVGTLVNWGSSFYQMRVTAVGAGQIQFHTLSGYFGWGGGNVIATTLSYTLSGALTAAANWKSPGAGNTVAVTANAVSANVGDVVWVGSVGADQFQIIAIAQ